LDDASNDAEGNIMDHSTGLCRRAPPAGPRAMEDIASLDITSLWGVWPITRGWDWCGEFKHEENATL
jgi:hypothetical protein